MLGWSAARQPSSWWRSAGNPAGRGGAGAEVGPAIDSRRSARELAFEAEGFWQGGEDQGPCLNELLFGFTGRVFVDDEVLLDVGFDAARAGLANLTGRGSLTSGRKMPMARGSLS
jgi:hypothetical protein